MGKRGMKDDQRRAMFANMGGSGNKPKKKNWKPKKPKKTTQRSGKPAPYKARNKRKGRALVNLKHTRTNKTSRMSTMPKTQTKKGWAQDKRLVSKQKRVSAVSIESGNEVHDRLVRHVGDSDTELTGSAKKPEIKMSKSNLVAYLQTREGEYPTYKEISQKTGIPLSEVKETLRTLKEENPDLELYLSEKTFLVEKKKVVTEKRDFKAEIEQVEQQITNEESLRKGRTFRKMGGLTPGLGESQEEIKRLKKERAQLKREEKKALRTQKQTKLPLQIGDQVARIHPDGSQGSTVTVREYELRSKQKKIDSGQYKIIQRRQADPKVVLEKKRTERDKLKAFASKLPTLKTGRGRGGDWYYPDGASAFSTKRQWLEENEAFIREHTGESVTGKSSTRRYQYANYDKIRRGLWRKYYQLRDEVAEGV